MLIIVTENYNVTLLQLINPTLLETEISQASSGGKESVISQLQSALAVMNLDMPGMLKLLHMRTHEHHSTSGIAIQKL